MLELRNIKKYYKMGDNIVKALDGINLKVDDGEFVTIIGPSGSGKSTMMNIIGCLDVATEGDYLVDGVEISKFSENQLAFLRNKKMGFIFQGFNLLQNISAYENVELPLIYQGIGKSERHQRVITSLKLVGMNERMKHKPTELSGGQQQRVAIARALATKPMCILADEPTGNLDSVTGDEIMAILKKLNEDGTTVIIITHNDEIAKCSRRVVRIHDGKIDSDIINKNIMGYQSVENVADDKDAAISVKNSNKSNDSKNTVRKNNSSKNKKSNVTKILDDTKNNTTSLSINKKTNNSFKGSAKKTATKEDK